MQHLKFPSRTQAGDRRQSFKSLFMAALLAICVITLSALAVGLRGAGRKSQEARAAAQGDSAAQKQVTPTLAINLTRFGFEPAAATVPAGNCFLAVRNLTGRDGIDLTILRKNGDNLLTERTQKEKKRWDRVLNLTPGEYVLSVADRPDWTYTLTVLPPGK
jgi:uncharacterized cupredoxin-like copper-binding protein